MKFNTFGNFNRLSHFQNREMIIFPSGIYQKVQYDFVEFLRMITPFENQSQYDMALNGLEEGDKRTMKAVADIEPWNAFNIADMAISNKAQNMIYNTALFLLKNPALHGKTFKIDVFASRNNEDNKIKIFTYIPKQFNVSGRDTDLDKYLKNSYLLAEYYFSDEEIDHHLLSRANVNSPHLLVICQHFGEHNYSLTKDAKYYACFYNSVISSNITQTLNVKIRDSYFLKARNDLDLEIRRLVESKWENNDTNSIVKYEVDPDIVLSGYNKDMNVIQSYKNINLNEEDLADNIVEEDAEVADESPAQEQEKVDEPEEPTVEKKTYVELPKTEGKGSTKTVKELLSAQKKAKDKAQEKQPPKETQEEVEDNNDYNRASSFFGNGSNDDNEMSEWANKGDYNNL